MNYSFKSVQLFFSNILDQVRASLSPASCINCELIIKKEGLCLECFKKIKPAISTVVSGLKRTIIPVYAAGIYEGVLVKLVLQKYKNNEQAFIGAAEIIYENQLKYMNADFLIPIPLHYKKNKERGFDQVEIIAKNLSKLSGITCLQALSRIKNTSPQANLTRLERQQNLANAFDIINPELLYQKDLIIIDDVYTTGTTAYEVIKLLETAKPKTLRVLVLARAI